MITLQITNNGINQGTLTSSSASVIINSLSKTLCRYIDANLENIIQTELSNVGESGFYHGYNNADYCEIKAI
tara:strand:+ start:521 stop:736 length:216 start_codon:yes stop_codon:yes gene_type:complete